MVKSLSLLFLFLFLFLLPLSITAEPRKTLPNSVEPKKTDSTADVPQGKIKFGGYQPIPDVTKPHIQYLGNFAVAEHNKKAGTHLKFFKVYAGQYQRVAGTNYILQIEAGNGGLIGHFNATVFESLKKKLELKEFKYIKPKELS